MKTTGKPWRIHIQKQPRRTLRRLPKSLGQRIDRAILALADDPRPAASRKLVGYDNLYRIRVGDWHVIYTIEDDRLLILVIRIAPRGGAYQNLRNKGVNEL